MITNHRNSANQGFQVDYRNLRSTQYNAYNPPMLSGDTQQNESEAAFYYTICELQVNIKTKLLLEYHNDISLIFNIIINIIMTQLPSACWPIESCPSNIARQYSGSWLVAIPSTNIGRHKWNMSELNTIICALIAVKLYSASTTAALVLQSCSG